MIMGPLRTSLQTAMLGATFCAHPRFLAPSRHPQLGPILDPSVHQGKRIAVDFILQLKIRPRGYLVTPGKNPGPKMDSDNQKMEFLMIFGRDFL